MFKVVTLYGRVRHFNKLTQLYFRARSDSFHDPEDMPTLKNPQRFDLICERGDE